MYPPPDDEIRNYLDWTGSDFNEYQIRCFHLLGHIFRLVSDELDRLYSIKQPTYAALAKNWRKHMDESQNRARIYGQAVDGCSSDNLVRPRFTDSYFSLTFWPEEIAGEIPVLSKEEL